MEAEQKGKKIKRFFGTQPKKRTSPGRCLTRLGLVRATQWADFAVIGVPSPLFKYDNNLFMCGTFLHKLIHLPDNRTFLSTPKETYDLNLSAVT